MERPFWAAQKKMKANLLPSIRSSGEGNQDSRHIHIRDREAVLILLYSQGYLPCHIEAILLKTGGKGTRMRTLLMHFKGMINWTRPCRRANTLESIRSWITLHPKIFLCSSSIHARYLNTRVVFHLPHAAILTSAKLPQLKFSHHRWHLQKCIKNYLRLG